MLSLYRAVKALICHPCEQGVEPWRLLFQGSHRSGKVRENFFFPRSWKSQGTLKMVMENCFFWVKVRELFKFHAQIHECHFQTMKESQFWNLVTGDSFSRGTPRVWNSQGKRIIGHGKVRELQLHIFVGTLHRWISCLMYCVELWCCFYHRQRLDWHHFLVKDSLLK